MPEWTERWHFLEPFAIAIIHGRTAGKVLTFSESHQQLEVAVYEGKAFIQTRWEQAWGWGPALPHPSALLYWHILTFRAVWEDGRISAVTHSDWRPLGVVQGTGAGAPLGLAPHLKQKVASPVESNLIHSSHLENKQRCLVSLRHHVFLLYFQQPNLLLRVVWRSLKVFFGGFYSKKLFVLRQTGQTRQPGKETCLLSFSLCNCKTLCIGWNLLIRYIVVHYDTMSKTVYCEFYNWIYLFLIFLKRNSLGVFNSGCF